jgi:hypothetical protein
MIQQCLDLALGRAFTPDPLDSAVPLARRFAKRTLIALTIYKDGLEVTPVSFEGATPRFGEAAFAATSGEDVDAAFIRGFAERHKARECLVNLTAGYTAILSSRARRPETDEEALLLMRDNPERLLGEPPAQGCRYSLAFHPTHHFAIAFAHKENDINAAIALAAKADLGVARLQCGMSSLLIHLLDRCWAEVGREAELLFVGRASLFYLSATESGFGRPLFDIGMKEAALKQALGERIGKLKPDGRVILVNDSGWDIEGMIRERNPAATVVQPLKDQPAAALFACASDRPRLGYDLYPTERTVRPFAPASLRFVPALLWGSALATIAISASNALRITLAERQTKNLQAQTQQLDQDRQHAADQIDQAYSRAKTAGAIRDWLQISPSTQALLIALSREVEDATKQGVREDKPIAQLGSLSLTRLEGQPQMRLVVVTLGDPAACNRIFQRMSALFGRLGFETVDLRQTLVPQGFRYEHLLNVPKAVMP